MNLGIKSIGYYLPEKIETIESLLEQGKILDDMRNMKRGGFKQIHISKNESSFDMGLKAASIVLNQSSLDPEEIDLLIWGTTVVDNHLAGDWENEKSGREIEEYFKFSGFKLAETLNLSRASVIGLSQLTCSTFIHALSIVKGQFYINPQLKNALIVCSDRFPSDTRRDIGNTLLTDGACGMIVSRDCSALQVLDFDFISKGEYWNWNTGYQNFVKEAPRILAESMNRVLDRSQLTLDDIALIIPINLSVISWMFYAALIKQPLKKFYISNITEISHVMCSDIGINLSDALKEKKILPGHNVLLLSQGLGAQWASMTLKV